MVTSGINPMESEAESILRRAEDLKRAKDPWLRHFQLLGEYIHSVKRSFTEEHEPGDFLNQDLFDATGPRLAKTAASSVLSMLWPQESKRFRFTPPKSLKQTKAVKEYYEFISERVLERMDNPKAGLQTSLDEYMLDQMAFATSGIEVKPNEDTKLVYRPWGVKHMSIDEGANGFVDTVYIQIQMPVHKLVKEYGIDGVSEDVRTLFNEGVLHRMQKILFAIEPRINIKEGAKGVDRMPWKSTHLEMSSKHILRQGGFEEMPIKVARFNKLLGEIYGRGFGMDALPEILELNSIWESVTLAIELNLQPPMGVLDDGKLGSGEIDMSPGAINVFNISGRAGERNPIFPLFAVGELKQTVNLIEKLEQSVSDHFAIDRLLNFNNETQMTLGEAQIRLRLQNATLRSIFSRQIAELFNPLIERTFNILLEAGDLGTMPGEDPKPDMPQIPDEVAELMLAGEDVYKIEYFTPAMRILQAEEAEGILRSWEFVGQVSPLVPTIIDNFDADESARMFRSIVGGPSRMERAEVDVEAIRSAREEKQEQQEQQEAISQGAEAARNIGQSNLLDQLSIPAA